jgi:hypothetical protein
LEWVSAYPSLDKGYDFQEVRDIVTEFGFTAHIRARGEEAQALKREAGQLQAVLGGEAQRPSKTA